MSLEQWKPVPSYHPTSRRTSSRGCCANSPAAPFARFVWCRRGWIPERQLILSKPPAGCATGTLPRGRQRRRADAWSRPAPRARSRQRHLPPESATLNYENLLRWARRRVRQSTVCMDTRVITSTRTDSGSPIGLRQHFVIGVLVVKIIAATR